MKRVINRANLFCGKDVAAALGYKIQKRLCASMSLEDKGVNEMVTTSGGTQQSTFLNESGLYFPSLYDQQVEVLNVTSSEIPNFTYLKKLNSLEIPKIKGRAKSAPRSTKTSTFTPRISTFFLQKRSFMRCFENTS